MRIEFDAGNATELSAVFVAIAVLRGGDMSLPLLDDNGEGGVAMVPPAPPVAPPVAPAPPAPIAAVAESLPPPLAPPVGASPAVPPPPVGTTAPPAPLPAPAGVDVDAEGLPYDKRIHSSPASKKKNGKWRGKRGLDDATRQAVTAELKQAMAAPAPGAEAATVPPPPMFEESAPGVPLPPTDDGVSAATAFGAEGAAAASSVPPPPVAATPVVPPAPPVAAVPVAPAPAAAPPAAPTGPATDFASLMRKITGLQSAGHLTVQGTTEISQSLGLTGVRDLMHRPDLIAPFDALLPVVG